jgi:hypothetical protein
MSSVPNLGLVAGMTAYTPEEEALIALVDEVLAREPEEHDAFTRQRILDHVKKSLRKSMQHFIGTVPTKEAMERVMKDTLNSMEKQAIIPRGRVLNMEADPLTGTINVTLSVPLDYIKMSVKL